MRLVFLLPFGILFACTSSHTGPGAGVDSGPGAGADSGPGTGVDSGPGTGVDSGPGTDVDAGAGTGLYDDCAVTSDCTLVATTCCGVCGSPQRGDVAAVNTDRTEDYYLDVACPEAREEPPLCPECASMLNPHLAATCDMTGIRPACAVVDFATPEYASCTADTDCRLAAPECCACGEIDAYETIAVRHDASLHAVLCDFDAACPPCAATFDPRATARCIEGACVVELE